MLPFTRGTLASLALLSILSVPSQARAGQLEFPFGFDMDAGGPTQAGFQSVTTCTLTPGSTPTPACQRFVDFPTGSVGAGYLPSQRPITGFSVQPVGPTDSPDLWSDGHRVSGEQATLRITGLPPRDYLLTLLSHFPGGSSLDRTVFVVNEVSVGGISNIPEPSADLFLLQTLTVAVQVDETGIIDIHYGRSGLGLSGTLNGVLLAIPEPASLWLLMLGALAGVGASRLRCGSCRSPR